MHVAICDDNVADRKQMERLLARESDRRMSKDGNLYVDSYGNSRALLTNPMQYDVFYIDICHTDGVDGTKVAQALISVGVRATIVMCCSDIDYRTSEYTGNVLFLEKPIKVAELSATLDAAQEYLSSAEGKIELRDDSETFYVSESDILYAEEDGRHLIVHLADGGKTRVNSSALNLLAQVENFPTFYAPNNHCVVNGRYVEHVGLLSLRMQDGAHISLYPDCRSYAKQIQDLYHP